MQDALTQQALLNYQSIVLQAQQEVANAIANYRYSKETVRILSQTVVDAKSATHLAVVRYRNGETDYTSVLDAQRNQLSVESDLVKTLGDIDLALCSLYRALGGGWQLRGDKDVISAQIKEEMAARTNWGGLLKPENHLPQALAKESSLEKTLPTW
jgi:outer membrane protein TolC